MKIEQIQALRILYNDFDSDYKALLDKSGKCHCVKSVEIRTEYGKNGLKNVFH